jgi:hypothetical protein
MMRAMILMMQMLLMMMESQDSSGTVLKVLRDVQTR